MLQPMSVQVCDVMGQDNSRIVTKSTEKLCDVTNRVETIIERIKKLAGLRFDKEVAEALGLKRTTLAQQKRVDRIPYEAIRNFAERANLSLDTILAGVEIFPSDTVPIEPSGPSALEPFTVQCGTAQLEFTPVSKIKALVSGGQGEFVYEEACEEIYSFRTDWLHRKGVVSSMRLAEVSGDSMLPTLSNGDFVLFDTSKREPRDGKIMVVGVDNHLLIKRVRISPDGIYLLSDNRVIYEPVFARAENTRFLGLVIWHCGDI